MEKLQGVGGVRADFLLEDDEGQGIDLSGGVVGRHVRLRIAQKQHPQAGRGNLLGAGDVGGENVRRPQHDVAGCRALARDKTDPRPFLRACERLALGNLPGGLGAADALDDRRHGGVGRVVRRAELSKGLQSLVLRMRADRLDPAERHGVLRQGAGFVRAHDVDPRQAFDGRKLVDQAFAHAQPHDAEGEGHRRRENEALGNHGDESAGDLDDDLAPIVLLDARLADDGQNPQRDKDPRDRLEDLVDARLQLGVHEGKLGRLGCELGRVGVGADLRRAVGAGSRRHERTGHDFVARLLGDGVGFSGQQRFVDLQIG